MNVDFFWLLNHYPAGFLIAVFAGFFGAAFFMLIELQKSLAESGVSDVRDMWTWGMIILRCLVGMGAAAILYFFFEAGIIDGVVWPDLQDLGTKPMLTGTFQDRYVPNPDLSLLVVWSFLAGYSQTLVPSLLLKTEGKNSVGPQ